MPIKTVLTSGCFSAFAKCKHAFASSRKSNPSAIAPSPCPPLRSERLGQQFVIENRPAAAGNLAVELVVRAPPDGYALLLVGEYNAVNATLYDKLDFKLNQAGTQSWSALMGALAETRAAFDRANQAAQEAFKRAA
jgi:hypothetical protein